MRTRSTDRRCSKWLSAFVGVAVACLIGSIRNADACGGGGGGFDPCSTLGTATVWQAETAAWSDAGSWTLGVPSYQKTATINNKGTAVIDDEDVFAKYLQMGIASTDEGYLTLVSTGSLLKVHCGTVVAFDGYAVIDQQGGTHSIVSGDLCLGYGYTGYGSYNLMDGLVSAVEGITAGREGFGSMFQYAGTVQSCRGPLVLGRYATGDGSYALSAGLLNVACGEVIGWEGQGAFQQSSGTNSIHGKLYLARGTNSYGAYSLYDGLVNASKEIVGETGYGSFSQFGGVNNMCGDLEIAAEPSLATSSYMLNNGSLSVGGSETVGKDATGTFDQFGGAHEINCTLTIGESEDSAGYFTIFGGSLEARKLRAGVLQGIGMLSILSPEPVIRIEDEVRLGEQCTLTAVPGAAIHMTGAVSAFRNEATIESALAGLANLNVIFEGKASGGCKCHCNPQWSTCEVSGTDLGDVAAGMTDNFALGTLTVGGANAANVKLVDQIDNENRTDGHREALYVHNVTVTAGSKLDLNRLKVYADGTVDIQGAVLNGTIHAITP